MPGSVIYRDIPPCDPDLLAEAGRYGMADLHEAMGAVRGRMALMTSRLRPLAPGLRIAAQAVTAFNYPGDALMVHKAVDIAGPGQVLVFTNGGSTHGAMMGELAALYACKRGIAGAIVDGAVRDADALSKMGFPVWSTAVSASHNEKRGPAALNVPIVCGGVRVDPGDVIVADGDGVLAIPRALLRLAVEGARRRAEREHEVRAAIQSGQSLFALMKIQDALDSAGVVEREGTWLEHGDDPHWSSDDKPG